MPQNKVRGRGYFSVDDNNVHDDGDYTGDHDDNGENTNDDNSSDIGNTDNNEDNTGTMQAMIRTPVTMMIILVTLLVSSTYTASEMLLNWNTCINDNTGNSNDY